MPRTWMGVHHLLTPHPRRTADNQLVRGALHLQKVCRFGYEVFSKSDGFYSSVKDDQMIWLLLLALALMLTRVFGTGNTQPNGKKLPINLIRNGSSKDASGAKPTLAPARPSTAIDPLSHVRFQQLQVSYISPPLPNIRKDYTHNRPRWRANVSNSTFSRGLIPKIPYPRSCGTAGGRRVQTTLK
jgi:hypothetical protein